MCNSDWCFNEISFSFHWWVYLAQPFDSTLTEQKKSCISCNESWLESSNSTEHEKPLDQKQQQAVIDWFVCTEAGNWWNTFQTSYRWLRHADSERGSG